MKKDEKKSDLIMATDTLSNNFESNYILSQLRSLQDAMQCLFSLIRNRLIAKHYVIKKH